MAERFSEPKKRPKQSKFPRRHKAVARIDEDGHPPKITGMRKIHSAAGQYYGMSGYGSDYSIMRRFLVRHIGQKWDNVYSEICKEADARSHDGFRLREAVGHIVEMNCSIDGNGIVHDSNGHRLFSYWRMHGFYVHPETGMLEYVPYKRWKKKDFQPTVFELDGDLYHKHDGNWYKVVMEPVSSSPYAAYGFYLPFADAFGADKEPKDDLQAMRRWSWGGWRDALERKYGLSPEKKLWYCKEKQSAGHRVIKRLKKKHNLE